MSSSSPPSRDSLTIAATSLRVKTLVTSAFGVTPIMRSTRLPHEFSSHSTGLTRVTTPISIGARTRAMRSGPASAMFLGTISPKTTCR